MMTFDNESISFLKRLDAKEWYHILDNIFNYEQLPAPIAYTYDYVSSYFLELNNAIVNSRDMSFLNDFHTILIKYYNDLPTEEAYFPRIYALHWILGNIKPRVEIVKQFYHRLFSGQLNNLYHEKIHLHTSLLSMIYTLPSIYENSNTSIYLFNSIGSINDYSFFRVALRYFIEKRPVEEYWNYFYRISTKFNNERFAFVLTESLMELRRFSGSFQELFKKINDLDDSYKEKFPELYGFIIALIDKNYLNPDGKWYNNDIYAKMLKAFINSRTYPPLPSIIIESWDKIEDSRKDEYFHYLFKNKNDWQYLFRFDEYSVVDVSPKKKAEETDPLVLMNALYDKNDNDDEIFEFYKDVYHIQNEMDVLGLNPSLELQNFIFFEMKDILSEKTGKVA